MIRWCHSAAQLGDVVTKDTNAARALWELFVRRGFRWKLNTISSLILREAVHNVELDENEFADNVPRDPKSVTLMT